MRKQLRPIHNSSTKNIPGKYRNRPPGIEFACVVKIDTGAIAIANDVSSNIACLKLYRIAQRINPLKTIT